MKRKIYGAYGSNMNLGQMALRCPKSKLLGNGILEDYKLTFRGGYKGFANIEPCKGRNVPIVLWEITAECELALDLYEEYPTLYKKEEVNVIVDNNLVKSMVYIMTDKYTDMVTPPTEYYFNLIVKGYCDNTLDLKPLQIAYSECVAK